MWPCLPKGGNSATHPAVQQLPSGRTSQDQPRSAHRREKGLREPLAPGHPDVTSGALAPNPTSEGAEQARSCLHSPCVSRALSGPGKAQMLLRRTSSEEPTHPTPLQTTAPGSQPAPCPLPACAARSAAKEDSEELHRPSSPSFPRRYLARSLRVTMPTTCRGRDRVKPRTDEQNVETTAASP